MTKAKLIWMCFFIFLTGLMWGWFMSSQINIKKTFSQIRPIREKQQQYSLINPLLAYEIPSSDELLPVKKKIESVIDTLPAEVDKVSVYYRDLNTSRWLGINDGEKFSPASLLKVPIMIAYFKLADSDPSILKKTLTYAGGVDLGSEQNIKPEQQIKVGNKYTISELISYMILYSDNNAVNILSASIDQNFLNEVFSDLGLESPGNDQGDTITSAEFSLYFRILYNATYLSRELSENAMELLTKTEYNQGLVSAVPAEMKIAHKFGERKFEEDGVLKSELHDCGIVYDPGKPYLLCIMTKGTSLDSLQSAIQQVAKIVYDQAQK